MQTFLPYPSFFESAACLDRQRLGKQRVEALQIARALTGRSEGWKNHPATRMWQEHVPALCCYGVACCVEWKARGYVDNCRAQFDEILAEFWGKSWSFSPAWLGNEAFHSAHRAALLAKAPEHYRAFGWSEEPRIAYVWPKGALGPRADGAPSAIRALTDSEETRG